MVNGQNVPVVNAWVQLVNNSTHTGYVSTAVTTGTGLFTVTGVPAGTYTVNVSTVSSNGPWTTTGDGNYYIGADVNSTNTFSAGQVIAGGSLTLSDSNSKVVPGAAQLSVRNHADSADNVSITDSGLMTVRNGLSVSSGGANITGNSTFAGSIQSSGQIAGVDFKADGGVGQFTNSGRFLGSMPVSGTPTIGTYNSGDTGLDTNGALITCSSGGSPGTWHGVGWLHWQSYVVGSGGALDTSSNPGGDLPVPSGFSHLMVIVSNAQDTSANGGGSFGGMQIAVSGGSIVRTPNYVWTDKDVFTTSGNATNEAVTGNSGDIAWSPFVLTGGGTGAWPSSSTIMIPAYSTSGTFKSAYWDIFQINNSTAVRRFGGGYITVVGPITALHFFARIATLAAGTTFDLYVMP